MSIEALNWALNLAPVPLDKGDKPNPACAAVLTGLANHADDDGNNAFPSVATLVRYTRLSERTVRTALDRLETDGIIRPCDPDIVAAHVKRHDRRPQGWNLGLGLTRLDLTDDEVEQMSRKFPGLKQRIAVAKARRDGVQPLHLATVDGVQPPPRRGATTAGRGAAVAPEPSSNHPDEPHRPSDGVARKGTRLPADWTPTAADRQFAADLGLAPDAVTHVGEVFRDYWVAVAGRQGVKLDWPATWRNWVRKDLHRNDGRKTDDIFAAAEARAIAAEQRMMSEQPALTDGGST